MSTNLATGFGCTAHLLWEVAAGESLGAGRRWGEFGDSVELAKLFAVHARTPDPSGSTTPCIARCELEPTTTVRTHAQTKYSQRSRGAYAQHLSRSAALHRSYSAKSLVPYTERSRNAGFMLTLTPNRRSEKQLRSDDFPVPNGRFGETAPLRSPWRMLSRDAIGIRATGHPFGTVRSTPQEAKHSRAMPHLCRAPLPLRPRIDSHWAVWNRFYSAVCSDPSQRAQDALPAIATSSARNSLPSHRVDPNSSECPSPTRLVRVLDRGRIPFTHLFRYLRIAPKPNPSVRSRLLVTVTSITSALHSGRTPVEILSKLHFEIKDTDLSLGPPKKFLYLSTCSIRQATYQIGSPQTRYRRNGWCHLKVTPIVA